MRTSAIIQCPHCGQKATYTFELDRYTALAFNVVAQAFKGMFWLILSLLLVASEPLTALILISGAVGIAITDAILVKALWAVARTLKSGASQRMYLNPTVAVSCKNRDCRKSFQAVVHFVVPNPGEAFNGCKVTSVDGSA